MATMDIFRADPFRLVEKTAALNKRPRIPTMLGAGGMNLFAVKRSRTKDIYFEEMEGTIGLVPTSERGDPLDVGTNDKRTVKTARTPRLAKASKLTAAEIDGVRAFDSETELQAVATEIAVRDEKERMNIELTWENMRLGAIQGIVTDSDGSTLYDWFNFFGVTQPTEIDFDLDNASPAAGALYKKCNEVRVNMYRAAKGLWFPSTTIYGLCDDLFWRDLVTHPEAAESFRNQARAGSMPAAMAYLENMEVFRFGGITFIHYLGTDDGATVGIAASKCKFFPANTPGAFEVVFSPGEFFGTVNRPGQELYSRIVIDPTAGNNLEQAAWVQSELYSYPLFYCTRPGMLQRARRT
jgi:hypothetical protein